MSSQSAFFSSQQERLIEFGRTSPEAHELFAKLSPEARVAALLAVERHLDSAMLEKGAADKTPGHKSAGKKAATATNPECAIASCNATHNASHGYFLKTNESTPVKPAHCSGATCTEAECCDFKGLCADSVCTGPLDLRTNESDPPLPEHCANTTCDEAECCTDA